MGHFGHASFQRRQGLVQWRGPKGSEPGWNEEVAPVREKSPAPDTWGLRISGVIVALLCLSLPREGLEAPERPQRITREAMGAQQLPAPALRGCCGEPTEFRWLFLDSEKAVAGQPFRTLLVARDSRGRQAKPAACNALRVGVDLSGQAHVSGASLPLSWRLGQLEFHIENRLAEVVDAEVRIESPDPEADVLLHTSRIHFKSGPFHSLGLQVEAASPQGSWPVRRELTLRVATEDRFGNPTAWDQSLEGLVLRSSAQQNALEMRPKNGLLALAGGEAKAFLTALRPCVVEIWLDKVSKADPSLRNATSRTLTFVDGEGVVHRSPSSFQKAFRSKASLSDAKWSSRADEVRDAFLHAWRGYERFAWGKDELQPVSRVGRNTFGGLGITILDSLSTLWLMGLDEEFKKALKFVREDLDFDQADGDVSVFEVTIRALGGLLGAHTLSGKEVLLERAQELGNRLLPAFQTASKMPWPTVNLARGTSKPSREPVILSEVGSLQVEFRCLTARTGDPRYQRAADEAFEAVQSIGIRGMLPVFLSAPGIPKVQAMASKFAFGALADSYYEYLLKQWLQKPSEQQKKELFLKVMDSLPGIVRPNPGKEPSQGKQAHYKLVELSADGHLEWKMDHLSCFAPGLIALGLMELPEHDLVNDRNASWWRLAEGLTASCFELWASSKSGLAPEFSKVSPKSGHKFIAAAADGRHSFLRPETAESLFYLYRLTGDEKYRHWGSKLFQAILDHAKVSHGFSSVRDVEAIPTAKMDEMQSFVMAETFKYLFLLFSPAAAFDMDHLFLNTEGHPLKRREL